MWPTEHSTCPRGTRQYPHAPPHHRSNVRPLPAAALPLARPRSRTRAPVAGGAGLAVAAPQALRTSLPPLPPPLSITKSARSISVDCSIGRRLGGQLLLFRSGVPLGSRVLAFGGASRLHADFSPGRCCGRDGCLRLGRRLRLWEGMRDRNWFRGDVGQRDGVSRQRSRIGGWGGIRQSHVSRSRVSR